MPCVGTGGRHVTNIRSSSTSVIRTELGGGGAMKKDQMHLSFTWNSVLWPGFIRLRVLLNACWIQPKNEQTYQSTVICLGSPKWLLYVADIGTIAIAVSRKSKWVRYRGQNPDRTQTEPRQNPARAQPEPSQDWLHSICLWALNR